MILAIVRQLISSAVALLLVLVCAISNAVARTDVLTSRWYPDQSSKTKSIALPPEKAAPVKVPRFDHPPVIDGKLDDEVWKQAVRLKDFYQTQPGDNLAPSQPTEVLLGYDSKFLYVAFHCYDDPAKVRANIAKRDDIFNDDYVGMLLDTFNDHRKAYELDFNPLGCRKTAFGRIRSITKTSIPIS